MYRWIFIAKNCVVSIRPVSPYQLPMPIDSGSALNAPRGCLSKPIATPRSNGPGADRRVGHRQRAAAGGAPVPDVDERQPGEPELVDEGVGVATVPAAAERELDVVPADAGVGEREAGRVHGLLAAGDAVVAAERVDADPDDRHTGHRPRL